ncbi:hypothetical protein GCM10023184_45440 [Flaviaesturariibacter amylovorans]|uniref:Uncharacterized protein n=1 Tax=Flaviaesturariibacter amylovorans TaxID=1084520 RepID=A0ABP8HTU6_9BACT
MGEWGGFDFAQPDKRVLSNGGCGEGLAQPDKCAPELMEQPEKERRSFMIHTMRADRIAPIFHSRELLIKMDGRI